MAVGLALRMANNMHLRHACHNAGGCRHHSRLVYGTGIRHSVSVFHASRRERLRSPDTQRSTLTILPHLRTHWMQLCTLTVDPEGFPMKLCTQSLWRWPPRRH